MSFVYYNPNPKGKIAEDCTVRAISALTNSTWDDAFILVCTAGFIEKTMPSEKSAINTLMQMIGYKRFEVPDTCPDCITIRKFAEAFPRGNYMVATGSHVVAIIDGDYYDAFDSGNEVTQNYWIERRQWK